MTSVAERLEEIVRGALGDAAVERVASKEEVNRDGEPIVRVTVVYRSGTEIGARRMSEIVGELWGALVSDGESASPVVTFVSNKDFEGAFAA